jgi:hypothetical protein
MTFLNKTILNTRIDFTEINNGIPIIHKSIRKISWDSSFMDLYNYADTISINNRGKRYRQILLTFNRQNLFPDWLDVKQDITVLINDKEFNLKTKGIETVWFGDFPTNKEDYYKITKEYFDNLFKNGQEIPSYDRTINYEINKELSISLAYSETHMMRWKFFLRIKRNIS